MARRRLNSLDDLRRYAADVVNRLESGKLDEMQAKSRMYCVNVLSGVLKDGELEERVSALEAALNPDSRPGAVPPRLRQ